MRLTECPLLYCGELINDIIDLCILWSKGIPPIAGGALDQTQSFIRTAIFTLGEIDYWKKKTGVIDGS